MCVHTHAASRTRTREVSTTTRTTTRETRLCYAMGVSMYVWSIYGMGAGGARGGAGRRARVGGRRRASAGRLELVVSNGHGVERAAVTRCAERDEGFEWFTERGGVDDGAVLVDGPFARGAGETGGRRLGRRSDGGSDGVLFVVVVVVAIDHVFALTIVVGV